MIGKSWEDQQADYRAGADEGKRRASQGDSNNWHADPDVAEGIRKGREQHETEKANAEGAASVLGVVAVVLFFFARAVWHAVKAPGEALVHYGLLSLLVAEIHRAASSEPLISFIVAVGAPFAMVTTFDFTLDAIRQAEIAIDRTLSGISPALGWLFFYTMLGLTLGAASFIIEINTKAGMLSLIVIEIPVVAAYAIAGVIAAGARLFFHPLAGKYNPLLG